MTFGLVGLGNAGFSAHLPAIAQLQREGKGRLVAAADINPARRAALVAQQPQVATFASGEELLASECPDVLVIATHPQAHPTLAASGLEHGAHVLCEKPLALSRGAHDRLRRGCEARPDLALVPVHQYRYSPPWSHLRSWARGAGRLRVPYSLEVEVERPGIDPSALSGWRAKATTGGMLADAGVHFLALASTIGAPLSRLEGAREFDANGNEQVMAGALIGSGTLAIRLRRGAPRRFTSIELRGGGASIAWSDNTLSGNLGQRTLLRRRVAALSDRDHVNTLYRPLYRDLVTRLPEPSWGQQQTEEAVSVGDALITLLERMEPTA